MASKYDAINKIKAENPNLTWTQAAHQAGFEGEWTSYKNKAKPRTGNTRGQSRRRSAFDQPSTELAGYESKQIKQQRADINTKAEMFGLEPAQIEHLADQSDIKNLTSGSGGDPDNLKIVRQSEARFKDKVKQIVGDKYGVTLNPAQESVKVIPKKFFDPIADPNLLPGVDVRINNFTEDTFNSLRKAVRSKTLGYAGILLGPAVVLATGGSPAEAAGAFVDAMPVIGDITADNTAPGTSNEPQRVAQRQQQLEAEREWAVNTVKSIGTSVRDLLFLR
jgi:hypothetical protein